MQAPEHSHVNRKARIKMADDGRNLRDSARNSTQERLREERLREREGRPPERADQAAYDGNGEYVDAYRRTHDGAQVAPVAPVARDTPPDAPASTRAYVPDGTMPVQQTAVAQTVEPGRPWDAVRWGPVWAGLLTTLGVFLVLELLAYGIGLLTATNSDGSVSASGASPWITGALGLIAFFMGGYIAERSAAARGGGAGLLNGFMVWALGTGLILVLSLMGLGSLFGALGNAIGGMLASGGQISGPGNVSGNRVAELSQNVALGAFLSLVLSAIAAALGGLLGSIGRATGHLRGRMSAWR